MSEWNYTRHQIHAWTNWESIVLKKQTVNQNMLYICVLSRGGFNKKNSLYTQKMAQKKKHRIEINSFLIMHLNKYEL